MPYVKKLFIYVNKSQGYFGAAQDYATQYDWPEDDAGAPWLIFNLFIPRIQYVYAPPNLQDIHVVNPSTYVEMLTYLPPPIKQKTTGPGPTPPPPPVPPQATPSFSAALVNV